MARGNRNSSSSALDGGNACTYGIGGTVRQATVHVAWSRESELGGRVLGVVELPRGGSVDGQGSRAGGGVGRESGVDLQRVEVLLGGLGEGGVEFECHGGSFPC